MTDGLTGTGPVGTIGAEVVDDATFARGVLARLTDWRPWFFRPQRVTLHRAAGAEGPGEAIGYQRVLLTVRALGLLVVALVTALSTSAHPAFLATAVIPLLAVVAIQASWLRGDHGLASWRRIAVLGLLCDGLAAILLAEAFITSPGWVGFVSYPLIALEAAVFFGLPGAFAAAAVTAVAFAAQAAQRSAMGHPITADSFAAVVSVIFVHAVFVGAYARVNRRVRLDLSTLLGLSGLLAHQDSPTRIVQALDARLRELLGARVRSVALRRPDGGYDILRWHSPETRIVSAEAVAQVSRAAGRNFERDFDERRAVTLAIEPGQDAALVAAIGLPGWVRSLTMVPIHTDGAVSGLLPVLWDTRRLPTDGELDLLHGLADQTGLAFAQAQLRRARELAATDSLTGLANHRSFQDVLARHIADVRARGGRISILFCDLDRFKAVNDRHGHAVGDLLLHRIAQAISSVARSGDLVARYGGDEIALILPDADRQVALDVGHRLRHEVRAVESRMGVDLTVGVAVYPDDASSQDELLAQADAAMYAGKRLGGGRVVHAGEISPEA